MGRAKNQAPHSADTRAKDGIKGFAGLPKCVLVSDAYRTLSLMARAILVEIVRRMDGRNNGTIHVSYAELAAALNRRNQAPIGPAIAELVAHGLIDISAESVWQERKAREYRLTFVNTSDSIGRPIRATNDYLQYPHKGKNDATDAVAGKPKAATPFVAAKRAAATYAVADAHVKPPFVPDVAATDGVIPIYLPSTGQRSEALLIPSSVHDPIAALSCEHCTETFAPGERGKPKRFCTEKCRKAAEAQRLRERRRAA